MTTKSRQECTCFNVSEDAIRSQLHNGTGTDDERLTNLQGSLQCGTQCGSCLPELRRLVRARNTATEPPSAPVTI